MSLADALAGGRLDPAQIGLLPWAPRQCWRVYPARFGPDGYNDTTLGSARFSPLFHRGKVVPTLYAGTTIEVALMETVLHDAPSPSAGFTLTLDVRTEHRRVALLESRSDLQVADLSAIGLRRLGLGRTEVIDCEKPGYPLTQQLAAWIYANSAAAQGIAWTSRQDDSGRAIMLFGDRMPAGALQVLRSGEEFTSGAHWQALLRLIERLGASVQITR